MRAFTFVRHLCGSQADPNVASLLAAFLLFVAPAAQGHHDCRPSGAPELTDAKLNSIVLSEIATLARVQEDAIDPNKPLAEFDRSGNGVFTYGQLLLNIEGRLSVRLSTASPEAQHALNAATAGEAYARSTVNALESVVVSAYRNTPVCAR